MLNKSSVGEKPFFSKPSDSPSQNDITTPSTSPQKKFFGVNYYSFFLIAIVTVLLSSWVSYLLILDPNAVLWINRFLPKSLQIPMAIQKPPQTLSFIQAQGENENLIMGDTIPLGEEILIPFYQNLKVCTENCRVLVELRVYLPVYTNEQELKYSLIDLITIGQLNGTFGDRFPDFSEALKLTKLEVLDQAPNLGGKWFNLTGETKDKTVSYGQILYYDPQQKNLSLLLPWQSRGKKLPHWQEVTGGKEPELLINQSQELFNPLFQVYTIKINPDYNRFEQEQERKKPYLILEEISLDKPAIVLPEYEKIMPQIQEKLWHLALENLNVLAKEIHPSIWTESATQQKDVIAFHEQILRSQCVQEQDNLENQITACLLSGNGSKALEQFRALLMTKKTRKVETILAWLKEDNLQLKQRVETILNFNNFNEDLKIWQGLMMYSQEGKESALSSLKKFENINQETINKFETVLGEIDLAMAKNIDYSAHSSRIIGTAIPMTNIELSQWQNPRSRDALKAIKAPQKWYIVEVNSFYDGKEWNHFPFTYLKLDQYRNSLLSLWKMLGLERDTRLKVVTKKPQGGEEITLVNIRGMRINNNKIQLLAMGVPLDENEKNLSQPLPLAYSESSFKMIDLGKVSLLDLYQIQPELMKKVLPKLWQGLPDQNKNPQVNNIEAILTNIGHWQLKTIDLTNNKQPEGILTLYTDSEGNIDTIPFPIESGKKATKIDQRTIIFSDQGEIIYNELKDDSPHFMMAIAELEQNQPPVLLIDNGQGRYTIKYWSGNQQKFIDFE